MPDSHVKNPLGAFSHRTARETRFFAMRPCVHHGALCQNSQGRFPNGKPSLWFFIQRLFSFSDIHCAVIKKTLPCAVWQPVPARFLFVICLALFLGSGLVAGLGLAQSAVSSASTVPPVLRLVYAANTQGSVFPCPT